MEEMKTVIYGCESSNQSSLQVTVFDGAKAPFIVPLRGDARITFGRHDPSTPDAEIDILLESQYVSRQIHGHFLKVQDRWYIEDLNSLNGLVSGGAKIRSKALSDGDIIRIDDKRAATKRGVLMLFGSTDARSKWQRFPIDGAQSIEIGRDSGCQIVLPHISVSRRHAVIRREGGEWYIRDNGSTNGVIVNGKPLEKHAQRLQEKDVITITNSQLLFTTSEIYYYCHSKSGISVDADDILIQSRQGRVLKTRSNHVSLNVLPGELVALVGGSGAGKSTLLNCLCGYLPPRKGHVYISGLDLYRNYNMLNQLMGYVPQTDIVFDNLTLEDMLKYAAKLRLPDSTSTERAAAIDRAIRLVQLEDMRNHLIGRMSGGQRKRASIAVELLPDPNLLFLDEPSSGLDPGTEHSLMHSLRDMANQGKTVILVTHSTLQLKMCDKIAFMGRGGNLCFCGSYDEALRFFGVSSVVDIYKKLNSECEIWRDRFTALTSNGIASSRNITQDKSAKRKAKHPKIHGVSQFFVLLRRNFHLQFNDRRGLVKQIAQTALLAWLMTLVANGSQFEEFEATQGLFFIMTCISCWIGLCMAIPEICKERSILHREYMTGLSPTAYILAKYVMLGVMCLVHTAIVTATFIAVIGCPKEGLLFNPYAELIITSFLIAFASAAMGLVLSAVSASADKAMKLAPVLLVPQILFSGVVFPLDGITKDISTVIICRWGMEGYGSIADLNSLPLKMQTLGFNILHEAQDAFEYTAAHLELCWAILLLFFLAMLVLTRLSLLNLRREGA